MLLNQLHSPIDLVFPREQENQNPFVGPFLHLISSLADFFDQLYIQFYKKYDE
jgi:hypothetical protein